MNLKKLKRITAAALAIIMLVSVSAVTVGASELMTDEDELELMFYSQKQINFFNAICPLAVQDMVENGILASLTIAQGIWESGWGTSNLALKANNLFGIKATVYWKGKAYSTGSGQVHDSYSEAAAQGGKIFRAYDSWQESVNDHSDLFNTAERYENLRGLRDYKLACNYLVEDGYTSSYEYAENLIWSIENYELTQYDDQALEIINAQENKDTVTAPTSITISNTALSMGIGESYQLSAVITPDEADKTVNWMSTDTSVVSVSNGTITAHKAGRADIIAETVNGLGIECTVIVDEKYACCVIEKNVLIKCDLKGAVAAIPYGVTEIKSGAFASSSEIKELVVPSSVTKINDGAFGSSPAFIVSGFSDSEAQRFATANGLDFKPLRTEKYEVNSEDKTISGVPEGYNAAETVAYFANFGKTASVYSDDDKLMPTSSEETVYTGCKLMLDGYEYTLIVSGDIDGDGALTVTDYILMKRALLNTYDFDGIAFAAADIEADGKITATDLLQLQKHLQHLYVING